MSHTAIVMLVLFVFASIGGCLVVLTSETRSPWEPSGWGGLGFLMLVIGGIGMLLVGFQVIPIG